MSGSESGRSLAAAALGLVGSRFLLHGRDPATGLDCVGVLSAALAAVGKTDCLPTNYTLRMRDVSVVHDLARRYGLAAVTGAHEVGDTILYRVGPCQFHFGIACASDQIIHAHAGLRRVVRSTPGPEWSVIGHWRLTECLPAT